MHFRRMLRPSIGLVFLCVMTIGCSAPPQSAPQAPRKTAVEPSLKQSPRVVQPPVTPEVQAKPSSPIQSLQLTRTSASGIDFEGVAFDSRSHRLVVVDQASGPGSTFADSEAAAISRNGLAASNAGFFTPEGAPLGKVISRGRQAGYWNRSSLGSGAYQEGASGSLSLLRRELASTSGGQRELLQAGPFLMENSHATPGLDGGKSAVRVFLAWDGGNRWWLGKTSPCTLAQLGGVLAKHAPASWRIHTALNLDGGRSADFWASASIPGGPAKFRPLWNRPVRNFLVLVPR